MKLDALPSDVFYTIYNKLDVVSAVAARETCRSICEHIPAHEHVHHPLDRASFMCHRETMTDRRALYIVRHGFLDNKSDFAPVLIQYAFIQKWMETLTWIYEQRKDLWHIFLGSSLEVERTMAILLDAHARDTLEWLLVRVVKDNIERESILEACCCMIVQWGNLSSLQWIYHVIKKTDPMSSSPSRYARMHKTIINSAIMHGHRDIVQWLFAYHQITHAHLVARSIEMAAYFGQFHILEWLHTYDKECPTCAMDYAASEGYLDIIKWLHKHRPRDCTTEAMDNAIMNGHIDVVDWLYCNRTEGCSNRSLV